MSRNHAALWSGLIACAALLPCASHAQQFTIDFDDLPSYTIPEDYGSRPGIPVTIWSSRQDDLLKLNSASRWDIDYGDLYNVAYVSPGERLVIRINVQPNASEVRLDSFSVGGYLGDVEMTWAVHDGSGALLAGPTPVTAPGTAAATVYPDVSATGNGLILVLGGDAYNGGTDNITFTVAEPGFRDGFEAP